MALFENFPWTNLHELNLDWLIQELKMVKDSAVISVNGETGEVILYQNPDIEFPATDNGGWDMVRKVDGSIAAGIRFTADGVAYLITGAQVKQLYDANHQPPYPVTSVNGQTGEVEIEAPVTSVNGLTGDVVLYSEQFVQLPSLTGEQIANWNFYRRINNILHGIQFDTDGRAYIMQGVNRYQIYTEENPQPLNFVDDENAGIMKISTDAPAGVWGLLRETDSGTAGIVFSYDAVTPTAYLQYLTQEGGQTVTHNVKLLTPDDIPSSSGVVSLNGLTGVVIINGSNLNYKSGSNFTIEDMIDNINQNVGDLADLETTVNTSAVDAINEVNGKAETNETAIENVKSTIAIVENDNTAAHNISSGQYVVWKNELYTARNAIAIGDTLSAGNLLPVNNGVGNDLLNSINIINAQLASLNFEAVQSDTDKTIHVVNVPANSVHFIIFTATGYSYHGYGIVAETSGGAIDANTLRLEGVTVTTASGNISIDVGPTARPLYMIDFLIRGNGHCTLS